ncbi:MAG: hypothetical protein LBF58_09540 [Deltaproteobacteria bacterium]|jgi:hypothetical protein|nr:hypothetical protein [Deltaproteobacteria bacterium]
MRFFLPKVAWIKIKGGKKGIKREIVAVTDNLKFRFTKTASEVKKSAFLGHFTPETLSLQFRRIEGLDTNGRLLHQPLQKTYLGHKP